MRSKRSLSINVNRVSKIIRMNEDGKSAISKAKNSHVESANRYKNTERAVSRGRGAVV